MKMPLFPSYFLLLALLPRANAYVPSINGDTPASLSMPRIRVRGDRFVTSDGSEFHFRGVNVVYKDPPYFPSKTAFDSNLSFTEDDVDLLQSWGVNLIRLGVMWPGVMPQENKPNALYLRAIDRLIELAASRGMYTIVEPHQDELNPRFCGEGAPDWWTNANTQVKDFPVPVQRTPFLSSPPNRGMCDQHSSFSYIWTHDAAAAYQKLWKHPAAFAEYWRTIAAHFKGNPAVLGGEIWNEPFPGDVYGSPALRDNKRADLENMQPFYEAIERVIHSSSGDPEMLVAYEPTWPVGDQDLNSSSILTPTSGFEALPGKDKIYAFHYYVAPCNPDFGAYLEARLADAKRLGAIPLITEFNLAVWDSASEKAMTGTFEELENRLVSHIGWQYKSYSGSLPTGTCTGCGNSFFHRSGKLNLGMARAIARPFAQIVAGKAIKRTYDTKTGIFSLTYETTADIATKTRIVAPGEWSSSVPEVHVSGGGKHITANRVRMPGRVVAEGVRLLAYHVFELTHEPSSLPKILTVTLTRGVEVIRI
eukprot:TRINITY_DN43436_c0_g1_i1.p1 TRINITY_DN43436_c0_g1~~TRINITY_DN43436_c0_g1_i1.p1  ORF type:complete len:534 (-),score=70.98 TRINITY_DN43436_c0_g1_i1:135-1736(-)